MEKRHIIVISFLFLFLLSVVLVYAASWPAEGSTNWYTPLKNCWNEKHNDDCTFKNDIVGTDQIIVDTIAAVDIGVDAVDGSELAQVTAFDFASLPDDTGGWAPNDATTSFTITEASLLAEVTEDAVILVTVDGSGGGDTCSVANIVANTNFFVTCASAPNDGSKLNVLVFDPT